MTTHHRTMNAEQINRIEHARHLLPEPGSQVVGELLEQIRHYDKLRERIAELEQQLATSLTPRPIAEAGEVKDGFVRFYLESRVLGWMGATFPEGDDTHFLDIRLPEPDPRAEYERAVAEAGGHYEAWLKAKGGAQ